MRALLIGMAIAAVGSAQSVVVDRVEGATAVVLQDGRRVRLQGLTLPTPVVRPTDFVARLRSWLEAHAVGRSFVLESDGAPASDDRADLVGVLRSTSDGSSLNAAALADGLAIYGCRSSSVRSSRELSAASTTAQRERRGWFAASPRPPVESLPYLHGAVLGLHHRDAERTYHRELDELAALGFRHVSFVFSAFLADVTATRIDRHHPRSVDDSRLIETIRYARERHGMTVSLLPIVLLLDAGDDDWRGTIRPEPEQEFWLEYDTFVCHYMDIAEHTGVEMVSVGSEFGSLEDRTETWLRLIENARGRFTGLLTYSVNWDHLHAPRFFEALDAVGMTAYFSLTDDVDASRAELVEAWQRVLKELERDVAGIDRPLFFTELGYASQNGINTDPWNYFIAVEDVDLAEQLDCFEAVLEVLPDAEFLHGAYWFDYFGDGGRGDSSYTPRGKPAIAAWREWATRTSERRIPRLDRR